MKRFVMYAFIIATGVCFGYAQNKILENMGGAFMLLSIIEGIILICQYIEE